MNHKRKKCVEMYNDILLRTIWHFIIDVIHTSTQCHSNSIPTCLHKRNENK